MIDCGMDQRREQQAHEPPTNAELHSHPGPHRYPSYAEMIERKCAEMRARMEAQRCWCGRRIAHQGAHRGPRKGGE